MIPVGGEGATLLATLHATADQDAAWTAAAFARLLALPGCFALAEATGFVLARLAADEAEILMLAVIPAARRQGMGRRLLAAAAAHAAVHGARALFLEVGAGNQAALALYRAAGFAEVGRRGKYYADGSDALVLRLSLSCGS